MLIQKNTFILVVILWVLVSQVSADEFVKKPNVAFKFYAGEPKKLNEHLDRLFATANVKPYKHHADIVIAPHAGYIYSGSVTAHAFKAVQSNNYETVIILAPSHYYPTDTVSVWAQGGFKTPLGMAAIDEEMAMRILAIDERITFDASVYDKEHSVEVEIPFIQKTFPKAKIVPMIMGGIDFSLMVKVAKGLREIIGDRQDVLIVVSSDMSHYFDDVTARKLDGNAIRTIQKYDIEGIIRNNNKTLAIDGVVPVLTAMLYAKDKGLKYIDKIKYAHSGHVSGDMNRVVGYAGIVFHNKEVIKEKVNFGEVGELTKKQKKKLLSVAEKSVKKYVVRGSKLKVRERDARLKKIGNGVFVTLYKEGELRGCMGHVTGSKPLSELVRNMAIASASSDPRFDKVVKSEIKHIDIEVSVLSRPHRINSIDEIELGKHGVILSQGKDHRGVFLPQVAKDTGWDKENFLSVLASQKAGLSADAWKDPKTKIEIFTATVFSRNDLK